MGVQPPFIYDAVRSDNGFDPKAVSRASLAPKPRRPKQEGPLLSFNKHPDSYLILPYGKSSAKLMSPSVKKWVKWMRIVQLTLRAIEVISAGGQLAFMILIGGVEASTAWIMRIAPGIAILHTVYGIYHLARRPTGRTPASSASYMLFASFLDVSIIPFYVFSAMVAKTRPEDGWKLILSNQDLLPMFSAILFFLAAVGAGLHLVSLAISIYLTVTFRKITKLPPDMNPLEDNLTSRHKRNKSSISMATAVSEKRISAPLESKRSSGAAYEDLARPPTIPFFHTRTQSTDSFSTYNSTPPPSRDARADLPSRQYGVLPHNSPRSSVVDLKRNSAIPQKQRGSYTEVPLTDNDNDFMPSSRNMGNMAEAWYTADSFSATRPRSASPKKTNGTTGNYQSVHQRYNSTSDVSSLSNHPNPLEANPPTPRHGHFPRSSQASNSPLSEISNNRRASGEDIADMSSQRLERHSSPVPVKENFKAKLYGELKPGTPPVMVGGKNGRQVSSGNDYTNSRNSFRVLDKRDVSGKIAEEGRGGKVENSWGTRFRKSSGL